MLRNFKFTKLNFALYMVCLLVTSVALQLAVRCVISAASADVTLRGNGNEIECDTTERTATIPANNVGLSINNKSTASVWVNLNAGTVSTSNGSTSIEIDTGTSLLLPKTCTSFTFKTASGTSYLRWKAP